MKNTSLDLTELLPDKKKDLYSLLNNIMNKLNVDYFIVGATARDLLLEFGYNIKSPRATLDTDLAIFIDSWQQFNKVRAAFEEYEEFVLNDKILYRIFSPKYGAIDIIPFGNIETNHTISWPPEFTHVMNMLGFSDAYRYAIELKVSNTETIKVASLEGIAALKLFAWQDRSHMNKDILDLAFIMDNYLNAGNLEHMYDEHPDLLVVDFDYEIASARMLGRGMAECASKHCHDELIKILSDNKQSHQNNNKFFQAIENMHFTTFGDVDRLLDKFKALRLGILD